MKNDINKDLIFCHHFFSTRLIFFAIRVEKRKKAGKPKDLPAF
jgi:hypothetical protein